MLQETELGRISVTYAREVATLRSFFQSAGVGIGQDRALAEVVSRLRAERAFRRDLLLHLSVIAHDTTREVSHADVFGTLVLAASGPEFAPSAAESDAHTLLRFVMDCRATIGQEESGRSEPERARVPVKDALRPSAQMPRADGAALRFVGPGAQTAEDLRSRKQLRKLGAAIAAVVLLAIALVALHKAFDKPVTQAGGTPADPSAIKPVPSGNEQPIAKLQEGPAAPEPSARPTERTRVDLPRRQILTTSTRNAAEVIATPATTTQAAASFPSADPLRFPPARVGKENMPTAAPAALPKADQLSPSRVPNPVPTYLLSQRLGARALPSEATLDAMVYASKHPQLQRRHPLLLQSEDPGDATSLIADRGSPNLPEGFAPGSERTLPAGVVRPVSLGIMAANILYSPAPAYPSAAAAARVQGEVRVQAEVDRNGNVASAHVVSGPALLRDAAVDAVQRWRYRPYLSQGRAVAMSTTAVMDFQLQ